MLAQTSKITKSPEDISATGEVRYIETKSLSLAKQSNPSDNTQEACADDQNRGSWFRH